MRRRLAKALTLVCSLLMSGTSMMLVAQTSAPQPSTTCSISTFRVPYPSGNVNSSTFAFGLNDYYNAVGAADAEFPRTDSAIGLIRYSNGSTAKYQVPGSSFTYLQARNNKGVMVGYYVNNLKSHGFRLQGSTMTTINYPGAVESAATGVNNYGSIVGYARSTAGGARFGFELRSGSYKKIMFPGAADTAANAIGDNGEVVGTFEYSVGGLSHGFTLINGVYKELDYPGAADTFATGVNKYGSVVGYYYPVSPGSGVSYGFIYRGGAFTKFVYPGAAETMLGGINNLGGLAGSESKDTNVFYGFVRKCQ